MAKEVFLLGGGGHGRVVLDALLSSGISVTGVIDPQIEAGTRVFDVLVVNDDDFLDQIDPKDVFLVNGLGANPSVRNRKKLFEDMKARGFSFKAVQHPSAVISRECDLYEGSQIMAGVVLQHRVRIGNNTVINTRASVDHDCVIGANVFISPSAVLCGMVTLAESAFIGSGAVLLPEIQIGANAIIGAGAVVTKPVPAEWIVAGNPAVKIGINK
jgi:sugar O-acyltransferase (sialic acid O-acetyltransferase NeuD family)